MISVRVDAKSSAMLYSFYIPLLLNQKVMIGTAGAVRRATTYELGNLLVSLSAILPDLLARWEQFR